MGECTTLYEDKGSLVGLPYDTMPVNTLRRGKGAETAGRRNKEALP